MCLAQGHNAVTPVRLEPAAPQSQVKHSTTEPLPSLFFVCDNLNANSMDLDQDLQNVSPGLDPNHLTL